MFFLPDTNHEDIDNFRQLVDLSQDELIQIGKYTIYWIIKKEAYAPSFYHAKFIKIELYKHASIRNYKTAYYLAYK